MTKTAFTQELTMRLSVAYASLGLKEEKILDSYDLAQKIADRVFTRNLVGKIKDKQQDLHVAMDDVEKDSIKYALQVNNDNRAAAAKQLGISERTIYRKIIQYNL